MFIFPVLHVMSCTHIFSDSVSISPHLLSDNLNNALGAIRVLGLELIEDELKPHLNTVLINIKERSEFISHWNTLNSIYHSASQLSWCVEPFGAIWIAMCRQWCHTCNIHIYVSKSSIHWGIIMPPSLTLWLIKPLVGDGCGAGGWEAVKGSWPVDVKLYLCLPARQQQRERERQRR